MRCMVYAQFFFWKSTFFATFAPIDGQKVAKTSKNRGLSIMSIQKGLSAFQTATTLENQFRHIFYTVMHKILFFDISRPAAKPVWQLRLKQLGFVGPLNTASIQSLGEIGEIKWWFCPKHYGLIVLQVATRPCLKSFFFN